MKTVAFLIALGLVSFAALDGVEPKDAKDVLDAANTACAFRESLPKEAKPVCEKLDEAQRAARDAAKAVLDAVPEAK